MKKMQGFSLKRLEKKKKTAADRYLHSHNIRRVITRREFVLSNFNSVMYRSFQNIFVFRVRVIILWIRFRVSFFFFYVWENCARIFYKRKLHLFSDLVYLARTNFLVFYFLFSFFFILIWDIINALSFQWFCTSAQLDVIFS